MSFVSKDWLLEHNMYGNSEPISHRLYAESLIKSAPVYSSFGDEINKRLLEIEGYVCDVNIKEIVSHIEDGTLQSWLSSWHSAILEQINSIKKT